MMPLVLNLYPLVSPVNPCIFGMFPVALWRRPNPVFPHTLTPSSSNELHLLESEIAS